jgi:CubicO group peptidase (beta-lactamase class C family)
VSLLAAVASWDVPNAAAAVVAADGTVVETAGDIDRAFRIASLTKVVSGWTTMIAVEEGLLGLDDPAGQPGCTVRHLLAHAGGYGFDGPAPVAKPERRRIYSNTGIELAGDAVATAAGMSFGSYLSAGVLEPLGMTASSLRGSPAHGLVTTVRDLTKLLAELQRSRLLSPAGAAEVTSIQYPGLTGIVPGVGRFDPCPWGLGVEIHGDKSPHWMGATNSPATFGHFGGAGTMMWADPAAGRALVALTDRRFDDWPDAVESWRHLSDTVIAEVGRGDMAVAGGGAG